MHPAAENRTTHSSLRRPGERTRWAVWPQLSMYSTRTSCMSSRKRSAVAGSTIWSSLPHTTSVFVVTCSGDTLGSHRAFQTLRSCHCTRPSSCATYVGNQRSDSVAAGLHPTNDGFLPAVHHAVQAANLECVLRAIAFRVVVRHLVRLVAQPLGLRTERHAMQPGCQQSPAS